MARRAAPAAGHAGVEPSTRFQAVDRQGQRVEVSDLDARRVWVAAGGRCTFCKEFLAEDATTGQAVFTGQLAHVVGATEQPGSPRGKSSKTRAERALPENLMLLCPGEHKVIDAHQHWTTYDEDTLLAFKTQHERDVRELTGLVRKPKSTVIRVARDIRGQAVDFSKQAVIRALLDQQRFPDFSLHEDGRNCEVDLRDLEGEGDSDGSYWAAAQLKLTRRLAPLKQHLKDNHIDHISVFALGRIPVLVQLGALLDDVTNVATHNAVTDEDGITVNNRRRGTDGGWGWPAEHRTENLAFAVNQVPGEGDPVVTISLSGPVDVAALPPELRGRPRYDLRANGVGLSPTILQSAKDLDVFTDAWRGLLARLEDDHRSQPISLLMAVPAAAAIEVGRAHMKAAHPPLRVYDRVDSTYALALVVSP